MAARRGGVGGRARGRRSQAKSHVRCSAGAERIGSKSNAVASRCICRDSRLKLPLRRTHINFYGRRKWLLHNARHRRRSRRRRRGTETKEQRPKTESRKAFARWLPDCLMTFWEILYGIYDMCKKIASDEREKKRKCSENRTAGFHFPFSYLSSCCCCIFKDTFGIKNNVP